MRMWCQLPAIDSPPKHPNHFKGTICGWQLLYTHFCSTRSTLMLTWATPSHTVALIVCCELLLSHR